MAAGRPVTIARIVRTLTMRLKTIVVVVTDSKRSASYGMFLTNLREIMERYLDSKNSNTFEALKEDYLTEQYLSSLKDNVRSFVISKKPASALECAQMSTWRWPFFEEKQLQFYETGTQSLISSYRYSKETANIISKKCSQLI